MQFRTVIGGVLGIGVVLASFLLPFWQLTSASGNLVSLYSSLAFVASNITSVESLGEQPAAILSYAVLAGAAMVIVGGLLGVRPRAGSLVASLGMLLTTTVPILFLPGYGTEPAVYGVGFWTLWILTAALFLLGVAGRGARTTAASSSAQAYASE